MEKSGFFNSVNGDRKYQDSDFADFFNSFITNGAFPNPSTSLQVLSSNNMTVTLKLGKAWINGHVYINGSDLTLNLDPADGVLKRIDRAVLRMDTAGRAINAVIKKGNFASNPVAPVLQRDADGYELGIADIYITAGAISITQANITDLRLNSDLCGVVSFVVPIDTTAIFNQYQNWYNTRTGQYQTDINNMEQQFQSDFNTWFDGIKAALDGDTAGNLLNMINGLAGSGRTTETVIGAYDKVNGLAGTGRTIETVKGNADAVDAVSNNLTSHKAESASTSQIGHVQLQSTVDTSESKALTPKALNDHVSDNVKHITSAERTSWNGKADRISDFLNSIANNGYQTLPSGLVIQWGTGSVTSGGMTVTLPIAFPHACFSVSCIIGSGSAYPVNVSSLSKTSFGATQTSGANQLIYYIAIGY